MGDRACKLSGCADVLPVGASMNTKYCSPECAQAATEIARWGAAAPPAVHPAHKAFAHGNWQQIGRRILEDNDG